MDFIRDPMWQFIGVVLAAIALIIPIAQHYRSKKKHKVTNTQDLSRYDVSYTGKSHEKHKKRKGDGILFANISSDFLNQFPATIGVLSKHLDAIYTPENFGASKWLDVFKRLIKEEYFVPVKKTPINKINLDTAIKPSPKLDHWFEMTVKARRSIMGLDDE